MESSSTPKDGPRTEVDTSRPFRSVKEAVAVFGERFLAAEVYSWSCSAAFRGRTTLRTSGSSPTVSLRSLASQSLVESDREAAFEITLKTLKFELEETRRELNRLKLRETDVELAVAALRAELQNCITLAEAATSAASPSKTSQTGEIIGESCGGHVATDQPSQFQCSRTLAQFLSHSEEETERGILRKMKPIIPLLTDVFSTKRSTSYPHLRKRPCSIVIC